MTHSCVPQPCAPQPCAPHPTCSSPQPQPCAPHEAYCQSQNSDHSCGYSDCGGDHSTASIGIDLDVHVTLDFVHDCGFA
jgi:hypothetical protein